MKILTASRRLLTLLSAALLCAVSAKAQAPNHLVISQVYGGGGGTTATTTYTYNTDYIELYNPTSSPINLAGLSLQYGSAAGNFGSSAGNVKAFTSGTVQPGKYFLVTASGGSVGGTIPVTADDTSTLTISATAGKVALVNQAGSISSLGAATSCTNAIVIDEVSFGAGTSCAEGTAAPAPSNTTAVLRSDPTKDSNNNSADFVAGTPNPRSSASGTGAPTATTVSISTMQANRSTYVGTSVSTTGVVTSVVYNGFFLQMPGTPASRTSGVSEGIDVYTGAAPTVHVGDNVTVTGSLTLFPAATASVTPALEISSPTVTTNSTGTTLPTPIVLTTADLTATGGLQQLTRYESMRVQMSLTATSGTGASGLNGASEVNETYTSNGYFYAVITGTARPFREPGVDVRDAGASALPSTIQRFDDNPERIYVATTLMNAAPIDVSTGAQFNNVTGILDFTYSNDSYYDPSRFIPDAGVMLANYTPGIQPVAATLPTANQATVAAFNIERFFNTSSADDKDYYAAANGGAGSVETSQAVDVTPAAYARRLAKVSLAIRHMLNNPDIVAVEEAENASVLKDIATQISADAATAGETDPKYVGYGVDNSTFYTNDLGGISVGFLVKSTVDVTGFDQFFATSTFTPTGGNLTTVDDRPPFVLHAGIKRGTGVKDYPVTVIVNHLKALPDTTTAVQQKKELQVEQLASLFQGYQAKGEHVLAVGDFNAFEFNDGYGDYLGTATNNVVAAPATTVTPGKSGLVTPAATDLALNLPANLRYSYVEDGSAQILDHVIASADIASSTQLAYVHFDADFPNTAYNDPTTPARTSDHDPALAYLTVPAPITSAGLNGTAAFPSTTVAVSSAGQAFTLTNSGETPITFTSAVATGDFSASNNCPATLAVGATCAINVVFKPTAAGARTGTLTVTTSATLSAVSLTGTGVAAVASNFTLTDSNNSTTTAVTLPAGSSTTIGLKLASLNGFAGSVTLTCATSGTVTGVACTAVSPVTLAAAGSATTSVVITTVARTVGSGLGGMPTQGRLLYLLLAATLAGAALSVRRAGRNVRMGALLMLLFALTLGISGCSDSVSTTTPNPSGTPTGTYTYTVTATGGGVTHTQTINLTVQ